MKAFDRIPVMSGAERRSCIILEDACCRLARDLAGELINLPEIKRDGVARSFVHDIIDTLAKRSREIQRSAGREEAEVYEVAVCKIVDMSEAAMDRLRKQMQADLVQRVGWEHIRRCTLISSIGGMLDICSRMHVILGGYKWKYPAAKEALKFIDERIEAELLNDQQPDTAVSRQRFEDLFRTMADNVVAVFGSENWREEVAE